MIVGVGIDMIEVDRLMAKVNKDNGFRELVFSTNEIEYCESNLKSENYAGRFAAKEAFLKATGWGLLLGSNLCDIEIESDERGKPSIRLSGEFKEKAEQNSWDKIHVSISHLKEIACAVVIIEK
jgi:holo-[acyl-carrier protein] synthase